MLPVALALPFVVVGIVVWKRARSESTKKLGAAIASIAVCFAVIVGLLELLPRLLT